MGATLIQPQVPLGLPCYDLKTIAYLHLGDALSPSVPEAPASAPTPQGEGWPAPRPESSRPPFLPSGPKGGRVEGVPGRRLLAPPKGSQDGRQALWGVDVPASMRVCSRPLTGGEYK